MAEKILIVDDESSILTALKEILQDEGFIIKTASNAEIAKQILLEDEGFNIHVSLIDIWMPGIDGLELLEWIKSEFPDHCVIIMTGHGSIETAVKATKKGAYDFIEKPLSLEKILLTVQHALREVNLRRENLELKNSQRLADHHIIGESQAIKTVMEQIELAAPTDGWVLINGENGTGKELVARQIHEKSLRNSKPFIELNCAAIPEELIESELFGHERGSFTGAVSKKIGKFDQANGGTLFLDEIGDMSLKTQAKILRVLQEQRFERVGGTKMFEVDVRIIAASNKNLQEEITAGHFREDLFYRLNVIPIEIPPLKDRTEDIPLLIRHFFSQYSNHSSASEKTISKQALKCLMDYHWPGNVRELKNIVERMIIMVKDLEIQLAHVPPVIRMSNSELIEVKNFPESLKEAKESFEKQFVESVLRKNHWNISKTADMIQVERSNLHKKIKQFEIIVPKE
ncbi:MAG: sigma-54 dependent transcriptional regulator [Deltaproteobacteria bacterium]|nr:sigma-54 dependent transcriptional regulator [Deltaproteobacteria bacterium]